MGQGPKKVYLNRILQKYIFQIFKKNWRLRRQKKYIPAKIGRGKINNIQGKMEKYTEIHSTYILILNKILILILMLKEKYT